MSAMYRIRALFCEVCGWCFENTVYFSAPKIQSDLGVEENEADADIEAGVGYD